MKLRLQGNSIRFRLGRAEIARLLQSGIIEESVSFPQPCGTHISYALESKGDNSQLDCRFEGSRLSVRVPASQIFDWATSERVEIQAQLKCGRSLVLKLLIEKDFQCLHRSEEPANDDAFPNPAAQTNTS